MAVLGMAEMVMTFGQWLTHLRGKERVADVARRLARQGVDLSQQHLYRLEEKPTPGGIEPNTLMKLAIAYWEGNYPSVEAAFWDLWQRAGYPLPPGFPAVLGTAVDDPARFDEIRTLLDLVGSWRTDEIARLNKEIAEKQDPEVKRLNDEFAVEPPITRLPGH